MHTASSHRCFHGECTSSTHARNKTETQGHQPSTSPSNWPLVCSYRQVNPQQLVRACSNVQSSNVFISYYCKTSENPKLELHVVGPVVGAPIGSTLPPSIQRTMGPRSTAVQRRASPRALAPASRTNKQLSATAFLAHNHQCGPPRRSFAQQCSRHCPRICALAEQSNRDGISRSCSAPPAARQQS